MKFIPRGNSYAYENKVNSAASSKSLPDIVKMDGPNVTNYADSGIILPLDQYITKSEKDQMVPSIITQGTYNNKLYALGETESSVLLFYNKKLLDAEGIKPPTTLKDAWTWDDVYNAAKKLTKNGIYGINLNWDLGEGQIYAFAPVIWSNGSELISKDGKKCSGYVNSSDAVESLGYIQRFAKEKLMNLQPTPTEFEDGKAAMFLIGTWEFAKLKDYPNLDYGVTYYPASPKTKKVVSPSGDWCWGVTSNSKHPKEAAEFVKWMASTNISTKMANAAGKPPANKNAFNNLSQYNSYPYSYSKRSGFKYCSSKTSFNILSCFITRI